MAEIQIRYDDGAGYERMMGAWSRAAGGSSSLIGWRPAMACVGSMSVAEAVHLPNCS